MELEYKMELITKMNKIYEKKKYLNPEKMKNLIKLEMNKIVDFSLLKYETKIDIKKIIIIQKFVRKKIKRKIIKKISKKNFENRLSVLKIREEENDDGKGWFSGFKNFIGL